MAAREIWYTVEYLDKERRCGKIHNWRILFYDGFDKPSATTNVETFNEVLPAIRDYYRLED